MRLLALLLLCLLPFAHVHAQADDPAPIRRCTGPDGQLIFTDRSCIDVQATPALPAPTATSPSQAAATAVAPPILCANSVADLKQAVVDAFAARNANRLAGLMLWNGYGRNGVVADIRQLQSLMEHPLLDLEAGGDGDGSAANGSDDLDQPAAADEHAAPGAPAMLVLHTADTDGSSRTTRLSVVRHAGCLWLRPQG